MERWQALLYFRMKTDLLFQGPGVFGLGVNQQFHNLVRGQVVLDVTVAGKLLQAGIDALVILLDLMTFAGDAQDFSGEFLFFGGLGPVLYFVVDLVAVVGDVFGILQRTAQFEGFFVEAGYQYGQPVLFLDFTCEADFRVV